MKFVSKEAFRSLSTSRPGMTCLFDGIANAVYRSGKRSHISQLCFTGGSFLHRTGETARSSSLSAIYNSPACRFGQDVLFAGGLIKDSNENN
jgi:hypothetical protein